MPDFTIGRGRVAPAYDLPSTVPYGDTSLALSLQGRTRGTSRRSLLAFAEAVDLPALVAVKVLDDLLARLNDLEDRLNSGALPFSQRVTGDLTAELRHRRLQVSV